MFTLKIEANTPLHRKLIDMLEPRVKRAQSENSKQHSRWRDAERRMVAYVAPNEADQVRERRRDGGAPQYTTIQIPYTYAVVMTAHTYWTSVFFARSPVHQFVGRHGQGENQVQALEALLQYQVDVGQLMAPYYLWLYDGAKYGVGILGTYWDQQTIHYGSIEQTPAGAVYVSKSVVGYTGNCGYNVAPYDFYHDPRVTMGNFQKGEFCVVKTRLGWHQILAGVEQGRYMNIAKLKAPGGSGSGDSEGGHVERPADTWQIEAPSPSGAPSHPMRVRLFEVYIKIVPAEWGLGASKNPEIWVFTMDEAMSVLIGASPLGAIHGQFPFDVIEPELEAYGLFNRGLPELVMPLQQTMDWLLNTHFYNVRATLNNQLVIDPSRVLMKDAEKGGPGFIFRLRPEAFGTDTRTAVHQVPMQDVTRGHMDDLGGIFSIGERTLGINEQMFGMLSQGATRRSATEVRTATGFGTNRQKTQTEWISASAFAPHAQKLLSSSQQYYTGEAKFRIVGDVALMAGEKFLNVTPELIAGQFDYVAVDGTLPIDRFAQVTMWKDMLSGLSSTDIGMQVLQTFDMAKIVGWMFTLGGLKNVNQFKAQVLAPGQLPVPGSIPIGGPGPDIAGGLSSIMAGAESPDINGSAVESGAAPYA